MRFLASSVVVAVTLSIAAPASAGSPQAETLFREGRKALDAGDYATACPKFAESERLEPAPGTLVNLADCEEHLGKLIQAREHFELAAAGYPRGDQRRSILADRVAVLDKRIAHLTLRLAPTAPAGTSVRKGNVIVAATSLGTSEPIDPGALAIVVTAPGRVDRTVNVTLADGETKEVPLDAGDPVPVVTNVVIDQHQPPVHDPAPRSNTKRTVGYVLGGVGIVSLATGIITGIVAAGNASTVKSHCNTNDYSCDQTGVDAASTGKVMAPVSTITLIAGAALTGAGVYLVLSSRSKTPTALIPFASPYGAGALLTRAF